MPKSSSFWLALGGHHNMARLQIPMDEKILVRVSSSIKGDVLILAWIRNSANGPSCMVEVGGNFDLLAIDQSLRHLAAVAESARDASPIASLVSCFPSIPRF